MYPEASSWSVKSCIHTYLKYVLKISSTLIYSNKTSLCRPMSEQWKLRKQEGFLPCQTPTLAMYPDKSPKHWMPAHQWDHAGGPLLFIFISELGLGLILAIWNPYLFNECCQIIIFWMLTHSGPDPLEN